MSSGQPWDPGSRRQFILDQTVQTVPPLCPELPMRLITDACPLWTAGDATLEALNLPAPYWGFAWPGGQALARYLLDHPEDVRGRRVLDFGAGCGIEALAALRVGAAQAVGADIDPFAEHAMHLNAELNGFEAAVWQPPEQHSAPSLEALTQANALAEVRADAPPRPTLFTTTLDLIDGPYAWDVVLAGDMFYDPVLARQVIHWLKRLADRGCRVLLGDPHRGQLNALDPALTLTAEAQYLAPSDVDIEGRYRKWTTVFSLR